MTISSRRACLSVLAAALLLGACSEQTGRAKEAAATAPLESRMAAQGAPGGAPSARRFVAVRNFVMIEVAAAEVEATLKQARERCAASDCEVLESSLSRSERGSPAQARMRIRIVPGAAEGFIDELARRGDVLERRVESEDKTAQVVDVEARLKNMTELRDRLRKLLSQPGTSVKDLAEVESQLSRVQGDLDSAAGLRQALAQETEKVAISIEIRPRRAIAEAGVFAPVADAFTAVGHTFAHSIAVLIGFVVAVAPWIVVLYVVYRLWRRLRRARAAKP
jgi:hypothetical protein